MASVHEIEIRIAVVRMQLRCFLVILIACAMCQLFPVRNTQEGLQPGDGFHQRLLQEIAADYSLDVDAGLSVAGTAKVSVPPASPTADALIESPCICWVHSDYWATGPPCLS